MIRKIGRSRRLREAEGDYVRIGRMTFPKDASAYGYDSAKSISDRTKAQYAKEKEAERKAAEERERERIRKETEKKGAIIYNDFMNIVNQGLNDDDLHEEVFSLLVPSSGMADTLAGEIYRALAKLMYRDLNDGDVFYSGYGLSDTCSSPAAFLIDFTDDEIAEYIKAIPDRADYDEEWSGYTDALNTLHRMVISYFEDHPEVFGEPADVDSIEYTNRCVDKWYENEHSNSVEINLGDIVSYNDFGNAEIDEDDVFYWLEDIARGYRGAYVDRTYDDYADICGLTREDADEIERNIDQWVDEFVRDNYEEPEDEDEDFDESLRRRITRRRIKNESISRDMRRNRRMGRR